MIVKNWLPEGKKAAVCFTIDDLHPARQSVDGYDAGGDLGKGAFGHVDWLLNRHPELIVTLFTTADWREKSPFPTRKTLAKIPLVRDWFYLADILEKGTMSLERFPEFVAYYSNHKQVEIGFHGLHHCHKGIKIPVEFQDESYEYCNREIAKMVEIFRKSGIKFENGFTPPAWNASENLVKALINNGVQYLASARDLNTPIAVAAKNSMSGLQGVSILYPEFIAHNKLIHFPSNFQITSDYDRAKSIIECGGIVSIKAHIIKNMYGFEALDGVNMKYMQFLDTIISKIEDDYGAAIWFTSMSAITNKIQANGIQV